MGGRSDDSFGLTAGVTRAQTALFTDADGVGVADAPPTVLSAVGRDDPAGEFDLLQEVSGGGTTQVALRTDRDLTSSEQASYSLSLRGRTLTGQELVFGSVTLDLSNTA